MSSEEIVFKIIKGSVVSPFTKEQRDEWLKYIIKEFYRLKRLEKEGKI